ncbi:hypothetical protein SF1_01600 [Sphingobacterium faecium NBRC 15299]|uniref:polysaccharide pyruvyl transferase family protein n=1 Tax=Sphingobacterium faecium TaxID=34087 RepID=UPI000D3A5E5A|nr:polysaccharide pyruvyl transferase family protein [Sphingobacterium faecium]PTX12469.1 polysaccharide pyruvyl transferase WcaK-like protein [Sphingobacterium faecium]GEM62178.1 hypothetical protein SF1_01600 [Sphingobacterium faecium NBRC 15299]
MIKSDIIFTGFYGQLNTGDDAFVEVASWGANKIWEKERCRFLAVQSKLPDTIVPSKGYPIRFPKTYDFQKNILINNTDYLISAGGSTIHSQLNSNNPKQIALNLKKKRSLIKIGAIGVSIGPFKTVADEKAVQDYLKSIDFIAVRDQRSFDFVSSVNTPYLPVNAFDLAAMLPEIYMSTNLQPFQKKTIGISVCPYESVHNGGDLKNEERRNNQIIALIKDLDKKGDFHFKFFIINGNSRVGDLKLTNQIIKAANPKNFSVNKYNTNTRKVWEEINKCNTVISTRLHGAIFACFGQTPFMLVEYHQKCADFLEDVGYDESARIFDAEFDIQEKSDIILSWCANASSYNLPKLLNEKIIQSKLNFDSIKL